MRRVRLTRDRLLAWHALARERHSREARQACPLCAHQDGQKDWAAVLQWLQALGYVTRQTPDGQLEVVCVADRDETSLYRLIAGRGDWV